MITAADLDDADEDGAAARQRFEQLQLRAVAVGSTLARTSQGFILTFGCHSRHTPDLETIAQLLKARPRKVD